MMLKQKFQREEYPIETAGEKFINNVGRAIVWAIRTFFKFWFVIPKRKDDKQVYMIETIAWFLILIGWLLLSYARYVKYGF